MNNLDIQYTALLKDILDNGVEKGDRTGTGTLSVFGRQIRHKMSEGFPLLTTKKVNFNAVKAELLWFLRGDTNIRYLIENGCNIWNGDAYKAYVLRYLNSTAHQVKNAFDGTDEPLSKDKFIDRIKVDDKFAERYGDLGPIYGKQWRKWCPSEEYSYGEIDQITKLISDIKTNPDSRRLMVNAWNVGEIDHMVLPPCHYGFQVYTTELTNKELYNYYENHDNKLYKELGEIKDLKKYAIEKQQYENAAKFRDKERKFIENNNLKSDPTRKISLMWNQRSVDTFLGLPFNIASYGLLLEIIADEVGMIPDELIGNLGDTHLYLNHINQAEEQIGREYTTKERIQLATASLTEQKVSDINKVNNADDRGYLEDLLNVGNIPHRTREPFKLPKFNNLQSKLDWENLKPKDINLSDYKYHGPIKAPLSN